MYQDSCTDFHKYMQINIILYTYTRTIRGVQLICDNPRRLAIFTTTIHIPLCLHNLGSRSNRLGIIIHIFLHEE